MKLGRLKLVLAALAAFAVLPLSTPATPVQTQRPRTAVAEQPPRPAIDVESYGIEVAVDPADLSLKGSAEIRLRTAAQNTVAVFDLDRRLRVSKVTMGGERVRYRQVDSTVTVEWDFLGQKPDDLLTLRIEYGGVLESEAVDLPPVPRSPGRTLDPPSRENPVFLRMDGNSALLLYEGKWFPTNGLYQDKAQMIVRAQSPAGWTAVSDLPASSLGDFRSPAPSFWGTLAFGDFRVAEVKTKRGSVTCHILKSDIAVARAIAASAARIQEIYEETFGEALSPSIHIIEAEDVDWGMRWSGGALALSSSKLKRDFDEIALGRAMAREWFPSRVAVKDPAADAWLEDGMAVFASLLYQERVLAPVEFQVQVDKILVKSLGYDGRMTTRMAGSQPHNSPEYRALVEYRGAYIFRMLRWVMDDNKFKELMKRYIETFEDTPASTDAFIRLASDVAGENLKYFFDQWLDSWGAPTFEAEYTVFRSKAGYEIRGTVRQDLDLFRMPVEIEIETDSESEFQRVELAGPSSVFNAMSDRKPRGLRIDPQRKILRSSPEIKVDVVLNRGEEYANDGRYNEAMTEYQHVIDQTPRHSLALFRLGEVLFQLGNLQAASQQFRDALNGNLQPRWVEAWAHINLGKIYDLRGFRDRAISEYQQVMNAGDDSFGATAEARQYLASPFRGAASAVGVD